MECSLFALCTIIIINCSADTGLHCNIITCITKTQIIMYYVDLTITISKPAFILSYWY